MRKILTLIILFIIFIISSCAMSYDTAIYDWDEINLPNELKNLTIENGNVIEKNGNITIIYPVEDFIFDWVMSNIQYKLYANGFHTVEQTLNEKEGNCANRALTILALYRKVTGNKGKLVYCSTNLGLHYTVKANGKLLSSVKDIYEIIDYDNIGNFIYYRQ